MTDAKAFPASVQGSTSISTPAIFQAHPNLTDITLDVPVDHTLQLTDDFLNKNIRDALTLIIRPPTCIVQRTTTQAISASPAFTTISWTTAITDSEAASVSQMFVAATPTKVFSRTPGWYECSADVSTSQAAGQTFMVLFQVNGTTKYGGDAIRHTQSGAQPHQVSYTTLIPLPNVGDYVETLVITSLTAGPPTLDNTLTLPKMSMRRVRGI